jgi:hypothetical protein
MRRIWLAAMLVCAASGARAQVDRAQLSGTVKDPQGAVIPGAAISLTHSASNVVTRVKTTGSGVYLTVSLPPGRYVVEAEAPGFQRGSQLVILDVGQRARVDFTLGLGGITESVTVEEARRLLATEDATLGTVIDQTAVARLPLAIRNWDDLLALVAGVQGDRFTEEGGGTSSGRTGGVNVHGQRSLQNNFLLDGVGNNSISTNVQELTTQVSRPSVDAIEEFKVVTSPYSAEYGRSPGAAISVTTKSGTSKVRGTLYEYYRNASLDANNFFSNRAGQPRPSNDQNQFGGNVGGPLVRDKAFFFLDYEGTRITRGVTRVTRVPTADERAGRFGAPVRDPATGLPFPGNAIPAARFDPVAVAMLDLLPQPNQQGANNYFRQPDVVDDSDRIMGRVDLRPSGNDTVFARYIYSKRRRFIPGAFGGLADGTGTSAFGDQEMRSHGLVAGWTRILGASMVNELRVSWSHAASDAVQEPFGQTTPSGALIPGVPADPTVAGGIAGVTIDGYFSGPGLGRLGSPDFLPKFQRTDQLEVMDTVSLVRGGHQLKLGVDVLAPMRNEYFDVPATRGSLRFRGRYTGNPMADFLLGYVSDAQLSNVYVVDQRHWAASGFVQDDWKLGAKLTLNLGLRYDFITPALEAANRQTNFVPGGGGQLVFATDGSLEQRGLVKPDSNNLAPRIGVVYRLDAKTVLRGGYGIFYNIFDRVGSEDQLALNPPGLVNNALTASSNTSPLFLLRSGFPADFLAPLNLDPAAGQLRRIRIRAVSEEAPKTTVHQASLGVQRQLGDFLVVSADAVLSLGRNLASLVNLNQPAGGGGALPYPNFGFIEWRAQNATSSYRGLDLSIERRFARGYGFTLAYTLSESRDQAAEHLSAQGSPSFPQDATNLGAWEGPSDFDVRHRFVASVVAELPFGKGKRWATSGVGRAVLGGWTISGIFALRSGRPFTVRQGGNNVGQGMTGLPNLVGDPKGDETIDRWFNVAAFQAVPSGTFGNAKRNTLRGPGWQSLDLSLTRQIATGTRVGALLRWDVFNVLNRANFGLPERDISTAATVGTITTLAGDARVMQLSVRLTF